MFVDAQKKFAGDRFIVNREIGRGAMGIVYEAFDSERDMPVALKTLRHVDENEIYRLKQEFRVLQNILHPNLCGLGELIEDNESCFFIMELVEGVDFLNLCQPGQWQRF